MDLMNSSIPFWTVIHFHTCRFLVSCRSLLLLTKSSALPEQKSSSTIWIQAAFVLIKNLLFHHFHINRFEWNKIGFNRRLIYIADKSEWIWLECFYWIFEFEKFHIQMGMTTVSLVQFREHLWKMFVPHSHTERRRTCEWQTLYVIVHSFNCQWEVVFICCTDIFSSKFNSLSHTKCTRVQMPYIP